MHHSQSTHSPSTTSTCKMEGRTSVTIHKHEALPPLGPQTCAMVPVTLAVPRGRCREVFPYPPDLPLTFPFHLLTPTSPPTRPPPPPCCFPIGSHPSRLPSSLQLTSCPAPRNTPSSTCPARRQPHRPPPHGPASGGSSANAASSATLLARSGRPSPTGSYSASAAQGCIGVSVWPQTSCAPSPWTSGRTTRSQ